MDEAGRDPAELRAAFRDIDRLNRLTFGYAPTLRWLDRLVARTGQRSLSVLDVGAGGGEMLRRIARWGAARGVALDLTGVDLSPVAEEVAREAGTPGRWITGNVFELPEEQRYDVILSALLAHHLTDTDLVRFLRWMDARAGHWLISDIHRHAIPWYGLWAGTRLLRLHPMVVNDATVSVARAFSGADWRRLVAEAGVPTRIAWQFPFRWAVSSDGAT
jgi:2-polyprenyl-3-methyl-5-hydroxy-6-metoxy-1,4-benzoquinol methylase